MITGREFSEPEHGMRAVGAFLLCAVLALGLHAGVLFAWRVQLGGTELVQVSGDSVEVALVEAQADLLESVPVTSANAPAPAAAPPPPPEASPMPPEPAQPLPVPPPPPEPAPVLVESSPPPAPDLTAPRKEPVPVLLPKEVAPPPVSTAPTNPPPVRMASKIAPPTKPTGVPQAAGGPKVPSGDAQGRVLEKPAYSVRPQVSYPADSRAAGEQGVVVLRITVNASGRPIAVRVESSSGFPRLDRAAVEGGWRCRVTNAFEGAQFESPLRFTLK